MDPTARNADSRLAAMGMGRGGMPPTQQGLVPMADAHYQPAHNPAESCQACKHFVGPDSCELVAGRINPQGVSDFFEPADKPTPGDTTDVPPAPMGAPR